MRKMFLLALVAVVGILLLASLSPAATLRGSIYNSKLELENDVLVEINTVPLQKFLSKDGNYQLQIPPGKYNLTVRKADLGALEEIEINHEGEYVYDLFLFPDVSKEEDLWKDVSPETLVVDVLAESSEWGCWL
ncbi:hypothetical protein HZC32_03220, partial [Candidatus Woesearchaeota archaeon]|nr:hypothetical protein [Candidatus Woesearchaeota archaeon]